MAIRGLIWLALLFVIAVALATVGRFDTGQVLLVYPPYRVDVSLNLFVVALVVLFILVYALLRIVRNIWRMPQRVAAYRARSRVAKAHAALRDAIGNLYAGRFSRAEKAARDALPMATTRARRASLPPRRRTACANTRGATNGFRRSMRPTGRTHV